MPAFEFEKRIEKLRKASLELELGKKPGNFNPAAEGELPAFDADNPGQLLYKIVSAREKQASELRGSLACWLFYLVAGWFAAIFIVLMFLMWVVPSAITAGVVIAMITAGSVNLVGLLLIVTNYLFDRDPTRALFGIGKSASQKSP